MLPSERERLTPSQARGRDEDEGRVIAAAHRGIEQRHHVDWRERTRLSPPDSRPLDRCRRVTCEQPVAHCAIKRPAEHGVRRCLEGLPGSGPPPPEARTSWRPGIVSSRYEHVSLILTSNLPFARWGDVFGDQVVAAAMIDRIVHHAEVITLKGTSHRLRNTGIDTLPSARPENTAH